ncbi:MAG: anhydro-N-acetylmuramic acid kinase [Acidobacteria bacterium]|nr:MAG: anhydro-N-acetylmuramic acid kinase [Acidobacteriota bacterium]
MKSLRIAGVMSGTSADGIDVAVMRISPAWRWWLEATHHAAYSRSERQAILAAAGDQATTSEIAALHGALGRRIGRAVRACDLSSLNAVASHGQTVFHAGRRATLQLGDAAMVAALAGAAVISDFRAADIAQGGEGAPLVPWSDGKLFAHPTRPRVVLNLGGIANLTFLPAGGEPAGIRGFDTGPGNMALDAFMQQISNGRQAYDKNGDYAVLGRVQPELLQALLQHPYFRRQPPKSCGREQFGAAYVAGIRRRFPRFNRHDLMATLVALTAHTVARHLPQEATEVIAAGGGTRNRALMAALKEAAPQARFLRSEEFGVPSQFREAMAFAMLGAAHLRGVPANLPAVTGARRAVVLGSFTPAPPQ